MARVDLTDVVYQENAMSRPVNGSKVSRASCDSTLQWVNPIGVFDSGVGGLTVLRALQEFLPEQSIIYFGDTAHLPYGTKTQAEILLLVRHILAWMQEYPVKMVVMACNTSSALALNIVRTEFEMPMLGVILPAARIAAQAGRRIGVLATPATTSSHAYRDAIQEIDPTISVWEVSCPQFVPLIEGNRLHHPESLAIVQQYLQPLLAKNIDTLIYGCTHYPHLSPLIEPLLPKSVMIIDPAIAVAKAVAQELKLLSHWQNKKMPSHMPNTRFYVSDRPQRFAKLTRQLLGYRPHLQVVVPGSTSPSLSSSHLSH